jgi:hypothetical protein
MKYMFAHAHAFNGDVRAWKVGKVKSMQKMFELDYAFDQDITGWNDAAVTVGFGTIDE